jgi:formylglycine-generating enzyme
MLGIGGFTTEARPLAPIVGRRGELPENLAKTAPRCLGLVENMLLSSLGALARLLFLVLPLPGAVPAGLKLDLAALAGVAALAELPDACAPDMALVDGEFCPALDYQCDRFVDAASPSCAEYARKPQCRYNGVSKRFCIDRHEWPNRIGERPKVFVTWYDAMELCHASGKRLCRRSEWTLACEGPKRAPYPYGWERLPSPCNVSRAVSAVQAGAFLDPRKRARELERLWQGDAIGSHPDCVSAFGAFDMVGNVDEWTDDREGDPGQFSTLNGGYWGPVRNTCRLTTKTHGPKFEFYQIGFRCCSEALDGIDAPVPARLPAFRLERRAGRDGWPVPNAADRAFESPELATQGAAL